MNWNDEGGAYDHQIWELSNSYSQLKAEGDLAGAARTMERLVVIYSNMEGSEVLHSVSLELLARDLLELGELQEAKLAAKQALEVDRQYIGMDLPYYPLHLILFADVLDKEGNQSKAINFRRDALNHMVAILKGDVAESTNRSTGRFYDPQQDREHMVRMCAAAVDLSMRTFGEGSPEHIEVMIHVAHFYENEYNPELAKAFYLEAVAAAERARRVYTPEFMYLLESTAEIYLMNDEEKEAEDIYKREIAVAKTLYGEESAEVSMSMGNLASVYLTRGESKKAEEVLSASIALDEKRDDEGSKDQMRRMRMLALAYSNRKEYAKALKYYSVVEEHLQPDGEDDPMLAAVLNQTGHMHRLLGRPERAVREYEKQLAAVERYYGDQSIYYTGVLQNLAEAHAAMGDQAEAKAYLDQINKLCQRYGYSRNPWV